MKINVRKKGKVKTFNLIKSWSDVTVEKWVKLVNLHKGSRSKEALETISALSDIPKKLINELGIQDVALILTKLSELQKLSKSKLRRIIKVEDQEFGFHPNLEDITLGEWSDIEHYIKLGVEKFMPQIMAVLYRPIVEQRNDKYSIEAYSGNIDVRAELFKKMKAEDVQGAMVFFYHLGNELLKILPLYLTQAMIRVQKEIKDKVLQKNGVTLA